MVRPPSAPPSAVREHRWPSAVLIVTAGTPLLRWLIARYAVHPGQPWRTTCDTCGAPISLEWPAALALLPPGRCGRCDQRLAAPGYAVELLTVAAIAVVVLAAPTVPLLLAGLAWIICAIPLCFIDSLVHRLPDVLTYPAAGLVLGLIATDALVSGHGDRLTRSALAALIYGGSALLLALMPAGRGLGAGDAKLLISTAALLGWWSWAAVFLAVFLGFLSASATGVAQVLTGRTNRDTRLPLGPHLGAGALVLLAVFATHRLS